MTVVRMKFLKEEDIKYISHLDLLRSIHRLFRRAELKMLYSRGFNPRPKVSFAMAMPVGMTSQAEYLDLEVPESVPANHILESLNEVAPNGLKFIQVKVIEGTLPTLSSVIREGIFNITIPLEEGCTHEQLEKSIDNVFQQEKIEIEKKSKKGKINIKDIRPLIKDIKIIQMEESYTILQTRLSLGSVENLNPQFLVNYLIENGKLYFKEFPKAKIHRVEMIIENDITPMDI